MFIRGGLAGPPSGKEAQDLLELRAELLRKKSKLDFMLRKNGGAVAKVRVPGCVRVARRSVLHQTP